MRYDSTVDIYSLGLVMYTLLNNNRPPFTDPYKNEMSYNDRKLANDRRLSGEPLPPPCNANPDLAGLILTACSFDPQRRFASAKAFKNALNSYKTLSANKNATYTSGPNQMDETVVATPPGGQKSDFHDYYEYNDEYEYTDTDVKDISTTGKKRNIKSVLLKISTLAMLFVLAFGFKQLCHAPMDLTIGIIFVGITVILICWNINWFLHRKKYDCYIRIYAANKNLFYVLTSLTILMFFWFVRYSK